MDRPWWEEVSCTGSITLASIFLELFPFVNFLKMPGQVTHVSCGTPNSSLRIFFMKEPTDQPYLICFRQWPETHIFFLGLMLSKAVTFYCLYPQVWRCVPSASRVSPATSWTPCPASWAFWRPTASARSMAIGQSSAQMTTVLTLWPTPTPANLSSFSTQRIWWSRCWP